MAAGLLNTLEHASEFDALAKLRPNEPYFMLLGRDRLAPPLIYEWADKHRTKVLAEFAAGKLTREQRDEELRKATQAEDISGGMVEYKNSWDQQRVAAPELTPTYTGAQLPEDAIRRDAIQRARARTSAACHQCVADLNAQAEEFDGTGLAEEAAACRAKIASLRHFADIIAPPRPLPGAKK